MSYLESDAPELILHVNNDELYVVHNAGFFSCTSISLFNIISYFNKYKSLPRIVHRDSQFSYYKTNNSENLVPLYFKENEEISIDYSQKIDFIKSEDSPQFSDYRNIYFSDIEKFVKKYFQPSDFVNKIINHFESLYNLDYENLCSVYYRGNDKITETPLGSYDEYFQKSLQIQKENPNIKFLVQTDETEFLNEFKTKFSNVISFEEMPHMTNRKSAMQYQLPREQLPVFGAYFLAATICVSRCKYLLTHSGNCGIWAVLYRGDVKNVHQYLIDKWL